jgi:hypothetical protein
VIFTPPDARHQIADPVVSRDGKTVAFISGIMSDFGSTGGDVYTLPVAGGARTSRPACTRRRAVSPGAATIICVRRAACLGAARKFVEYGRQSKASQRRNSPLAGEETASRRGMAAYPCLPVVRDGRSA